MSRGRRSNSAMRSRPIQFNAVYGPWRTMSMPGFTALEKRWLTLGGSLTAHLRMLGAVEVRITREAVGLPWRDEREPLKLGSRERAWIREVVLAVDGVPCVAAHSVTPLIASVGVWQAMRRLRARPLAELLYGDATVTRSALSSRRINARHPLYELGAAQVSGCLPHGFVARRSVFERQQSPLMVTECLLPAFWKRLTRDVDLETEAVVGRVCSHTQARDTGSHMAYPEDWQENRSRESHSTCA